MAKLLIEPQLLKAYARILKKHNLGTRYGRNEILNRLCSIAGFEGFSHYDQYLKKFGVSRDSAISAVNMTIPELDAWAQQFSEVLTSDMCLDVPTVIVGERAYPSTPLDKFIQYQVENVDKLPALRISGALYLISFMSGEDFFDPESMSLDCSSFLEYLRPDRLLPLAIMKRLNRYDDDNRRYGRNFHEGILAQAILATNRLDMTRNEFAELVDRILREEVEYLSVFGSKSDASSVKFGFPLFEGDGVTRTSLDCFNEIRKHTSLQKPLLLGFEKKASAFDKFLGSQKKVLLSTEKIRENIMINGSAGSGKTMALLTGVLRQALMNASGALIMDGKGDNNFFFSLKSLMRSHNRESDLMLLRLEHESELRRLNLEQFIKNRKVVLIMLPTLEMDPDNYEVPVRRILKRLSDTLPAMTKPMGGGYFPYTLVFDDCIRVFRDEETLDWMTGFIDRLNFHGVGVISSEQDLYHLGHNRERFGAKFRTHMLMKMECPEGTIFNLSKDEHRDLVTQGPGEFRYYTYGEERDKTSYQVPYRDISFIRKIYLTMG